MNAKQYQDEFLGLCAKIEARDKEISRLNRILARELVEHDELGAEFSFICTMKEEVRRYRDALLKIYDPKKYHHWEEDTYTRAGCFQFVAQQALFPEGET